MHTYSWLYKTVIITYRQFLVQRSRQLVFRVNPSLARCCHTCLHTCTCTCTCTCIQHTALQLMYSTCMQLVCKPIDISRPEFTTCTVQLQYVGRQTLSTVPTTIFCVVPEVLGNYITWLCIGGYANTNNIIIYMYIISKSG